QAFGNPVQRPGLSPGLIDVELSLQVLLHAQVGQRMHVAGDQLGQRAHARTVTRHGGQQGQRREALVQVLDDRQRLPYRTLAVEQHRYQRLRIDLTELGRALFTAIVQQVDRLLRIGQALEVEGDAD